MVQLSSLCFSKIKKATPLTSYHKIPPPSTTNIFITGGRGGALQWLINSRRRIPLESDHQGVCQYQRPLVGFVTRYDGGIGE